MIRCGCCGERGQQLQLAHGQAQRPAVDQGGVLGGPDLEAPATPARICAGSVAMLASMADGRGAAVTPA